MAHNKDVGQLIRVSLDGEKTTVPGNVMRNNSPLSSKHYNDYKVCMIPYTSPTPNAPASDICCNYYNYFKPPANARIAVPQPPGSFKVTEDCLKYKYPPQLWPAKPPAGWVPPPPPTPSPKPSKHNNSLAIGLGVGLGLGIPLIFLVLFLIIRRKRQPKPILI